MVFGNRAATSGSGVVFTRDPATGEPALYGDILFDAQGEDVVAGTHPTEPIAVLDERLPAVAADLREYATRLEHHFEDLCDIEFTIEEGRLWMLQVRVGKRSPQAALRIAVDLAEDESFSLSKAEAVARVRTLLADPPTITSARSGLVLPLITGLAASPGMATGPIVTSPEAAEAAAEAGQAAILVRAETSPDDVHGMARAAGILTSRGGLASHAAVVARGWGIPAVVGAAAMQIDDGQVVFGERTLEAGTVITIDGRTGEVFEGSIPSTIEVVPEARTLLAWATRARHRHRRGRGDSRGCRHRTRRPGPPRPGRSPLTSACGRSRSRASRRRQAVADAILATPADVEPILDQLAIDGLTTTVAGAHRLTEEGTARADELLDADRAAWGEEAAAAALDSLPRARPPRQGHRHRVAAPRRRRRRRQRPHRSRLRRRGPRAAGRSARRRDGLVHRRRGRPAAPRRTTGLASIGRSDGAQAGDGRYVASPRVDSYHGIWFELHEDLIGLAGRTRADEVAAGRA